MRVNSVNGGRKDKGGRSKKEKQRKWGGQNSAPT